MEVLTNIPFDLEPERVLRYMRLRNKNKNIEEMVQELIEIARPIAKPKAIYEVSYIDDRQGDTVTIDGVKFTGNVLRINLDPVERVFPYVATCGTELEEITIPSSDFMKTFCLDALKTVVVRTAVSHLSKHLTSYYALGEMSHMNPGSLDSWPITQQRQLFSIFGNVEEIIGVRLTESCVMVPTKSVSGVYFPTETRFESCQLCPRENCFGRRAEYDPELARQYREKLLE